MTTPDVAEVEAVGDPPAPAARRGASTDRRRAFGMMFGTFVVVLAGLVAYTMSVQDGVFTYALDDAAIHLTLARNLVHHGTFGIVPGTYQSASSSPIWEVLLGPLLLLTGDAEWTPLVLNVIAAGWALWTFSRLPLLQRLAAEGLGRVAVVALPLGLGLVPLALSGMEHTLHLAVTVQVLALLVDRLREEAVRAYVPMALLIAFGTLVRFETGFLAVAVAIVLVAVPVGEPARRRLGAAAMLVAAAVVPVAGFAIMNRAFGQYALPNSVVAKTPIGQKGLPIPTLAEFVDKLLSDPVLVIALLIGVAVLVLRARPRPRDLVTLVPLTVMLLTTGAHVLFAEIGWFERYQAYLIAGLLFGVLTAIGPITSADGRRRAALLLAAACVLRVPLLVNTPIATNNVYETEHHLGQFLRDNYPGEGVAVNDIGYVSWMHEGDVVDMVGLASYDMLKARKDGALSRAQTGAVLDAHGVRVMAVHDEFFDGIVPVGWPAAGRWCLTTRRLAVSSACVTFYAPAGAEHDRLRAALRAYAPRLPPSIEVSGG